MTVKAIIGAESDNPVTIPFAQDPNWNHLQQVSLLVVQGLYEVRTVEVINNTNKTYYLMPVP